ncbi:MAG TPA: hypothetical protein VGF45_21940 [Polyangia bacterium]
MKKQRKTNRRLISWALVGGIGLCGCGVFDPKAPGVDHGGHGNGGKTGSGGATGTSDAGARDNVIGTSGDKWVTYDANVDGGGNPAAKITGSAKAWDMGGGKMRMTLTVMGLPANTTFGSHLHKLACETNMAGGHYQHQPSPNPDGGADGGFTDPKYANATNEAWFDFTTDAQGAATQTTTVDWVPDADKAKAIVVHAMKTGTGGVAGAKLACLPFTFR